MGRAPRRPLLTEGVPEIPPEYLAKTGGDREKPPDPPPTAVAAPLHPPRKPKPGSFLDRLTTENPESRKLIHNTWVCLDDYGRPSGHPNYDWMGPIGGHPTCPRCGGQVAIQ